MKYTEKADIAAKAVKVLDSVTMKRQQVAAEKYAELAERDVTGLIPSNFASWKLSAEDKELKALVDGARWRMQKRLDKPRYTLKDGEWVRKGYEHGKIKPLSEVVTEDRFRAQRENIIRQSNDIAMMQANANKALYGPQMNAFLGGY